MRRGFTLLEVAIVITILSVLLTISIGIAHNAVGRTGLRSAENMLVQAVRRAQTQSQQNIGGSQYGIYVQTGSIIIFSGSTFDTRSTEHDITFEVNENVNFSGNLYDKMVAGTDGLVFTRFTGNPLIATFTGSIIMSMAGERREVIVNEKGTVRR